MDKETEKLLQRAWDNLFDAHATWYIFNRRVRLYRFFIGFTTWLGICLPLTVGGLIAFYETDFFKYILIVTIVLGIFQLFGTVWSLALKVTDSFSNAANSRQQNKVLESKWQKFIDLRKEDDENFYREFEKLLDYHEEVGLSDSEQNLKPSEISRGYRATLIHSGRECGDCDKKPDDMRPTGCPICGNFKRFRFFL